MALAQSNQAAYGGGYFNLVNIPEDIIILLAGYLDPPDILNLRKTCTQLRDLSRSLSLWSSLARAQHRTLSFDNPRFSNMSLDELEDFTMAAYYAGRRWLAPRIMIPPCVVFRTGERGQGLVGLHLLNHHWLVTVDLSGHVRLLDLSGSVQTRASRTHWTLTLPERDGGYHSSMLKLSVDGDHAIIAVTGLHRTSMCVVKVLMKSTTMISDTSGEPLILLHYLDGTSSRNVVIRDIHESSTSSLVLGSHFEYMLLYDWVSGSTRWVNLAGDGHDDEKENLTNYIVGLKFCGNNILCIRSRSMEVYTWSLNNASHIEAHRLSTRESQMQIFEVQTSDYNGESDEVYVLFSNLYSIGLCRVHLKNQLDVTIIGQKMTLEPRLGMLRAFSMGRVGRRGVWLVRLRKEFTMCVVPFLNPLPETGNPSDREMSIPTASVYDVRPFTYYDDEVLHCAFWDGTGRIVLGTRAGDIHILDCWKNPRH